LIRLGCNVACLASLEYLPAPPHNGGVKALALLTVALPLAAVPITYTLSGSVQASGGGQTYSGCFVWTVTADTSSVAGGQNAAVTSVMNFPGTGTPTLTGTYVSFQASSGTVIFGSASGTGLSVTSSSLKSWDLVSPVGPINAAAQLAGTPPVTVTQNSGTVITFTGTTPVSGCTASFQAVFPPPTITTVANAATNIPQALPSGGIAQGSIFIVQGSGLGPANIAIASNAFQSTTLSNTSVAVAVGGTTVNALMYYTSTGQVAALLPSNTPTGSGSVVVTYNNQASAAAPVTVVANNLGIFTTDSTGQGPGIVTYPDYSLVSASKAANCGGVYTTCGAANPGDTLTLWATGLGPVNGSDASGAGLGQNMGSIPLTVWLGGVQAPVLYQGRSGCCVGEDQIVFTVPAGTPTGCAVPLLIQIGNQISNNTVIPVASSGRTCTPSNAALAAQNLFQPLPLTYANIKLSRDSVNNGSGFQDDAKFQFVKVTSFVPGTQPFFPSYTDDQPLGTCLVYNNLNAKMNSAAGGSSSADAGASFTIKGPNGSKTVAVTPGQSSAVLSAAGSFLSPGAYTVTGVGGADIGQINASLTIPAQPTFGVSGLNSVTRANGGTFNWSGGVAGEVVQIQITGATDQSGTVGATAVCNVAASTGTFTVPAYALLPLPPTSYGGVLFQPLSAPQALSANGLNLGVISTSGASYFAGFALK